MPTRKVNFGLDSELVGRTNCTTLYNNLSRMVVSCQDVLRLNTLYTVPKNFLCGLPGRNFFDHEGRGGRKGSSPFLLSCARATSKSSLLALKKSAPRTLVCYAAVLVSSCSFPERCVTTLKGCVADYSYSVNDLINARGVYLILKVQVGAFTT